MEQQHSHLFNIKKIFSIHNIAPCIKPVPAKNTICNKCLYINPAHYNFCTNCGYPQKDDGAVMLYHLRAKHRSELLKKSEDAVKTARTALFVLGMLFLPGIVFLFSNYNNRVIAAIVFVTLSVLFFLLAGWSVLKPFSALTAGFVIVLCFSTITVFGEFANAFTTVGGVYTIALSMLVIYFLLRGVQGAYKSGLIKEETELC
ncbi:MAG TPA: hypothetical protein PLA68_06315 [Panacibacter sp.]|nr:hypothetical protein [Panacibacter sp.]